MVFLSKDKHLIFIHIPKTCGKTIKKTLIAQLDNDYTQTCDTFGYLFGQSCYDEKGYLCNPYHATYSSLKEQGLLDDNDFIYTFVRNPYDRFYSMYLHMKKLVISLLWVILIINLILLMMIQTLSSKILQVPLLLLLIYVNLIVLCKFSYIQLVFEISQKNFNQFIRDNRKHLEGLYYHVFKPQAEYVNLDALSFLGKEENFEDDFKRLLRQVGLKPVIYSTNIKTVREGKGYKYLHFFDDDIIAFVNDYYHRDFLMFNYPMVTT